jgi:restriction system protein
MARRRNQQSPGEALAAVIGFLFFFSLMSPSFRSQLSSAVVVGLSVLVLVGLAALVVRLFISSREDSATPGYPFKRPAPLAKQTEPAVFTPRSTPPIANVSQTEPSFSQSPFPHGAPGLGFNGDSAQEQAPRSLRQWDDQVLKVIEWRRFEKVTKEFLSLTGFVATETKTGADGGVDIRVHKPANPEQVGIVQCKAWNTYKVGVKVVRELFGIMASEKIRMGMIITSGDFTSEAEEFSRANKLKLVSGHDFLQLIKRLPEDKQQHLLNVALEGDYSTPTCPQCDVKMVRRESSKGRNAGGYFWGCCNYPRCKQTLVYRA